MFDKPLTQTSIRNELWKLHDENIEKFEEEVRKMIKKGYPSYELVGYDRKNKQVFMK